MDIPQWHEAGLDPKDVVSMVEISKMPGSPKYDALRSYMTGRRTHRILGPAPAPACRVSNRKVWLRSDIEVWLAPMLLTGFARHRATVARDGGPGKRSA